MPDHESHQDQASRSERDVTDDVRNWLKRQGYVLEMQVGRRIFAAQHARPRTQRVTPIQQGVPYVDIVTRKWRETDVVWTVPTPRVAGGPKYVAGRLEHEIATVFVIECKNTTAPWILFSDNSNRYAISIGENGQQLGSIECEPCSSLFAHMGTLEECRPIFPHEIAYAVTEKRSKGGDRDHAREAVMAAVSATLGLEAMHLKEVETGFISAHTRFLGMPTVITSSPLFVARLRNDGEIDVVPTKAFRVAGQHELIDYPINVDVVHIDAVESWVDANLEQMLVLAQSGYRATGNGGGS